MVVSPEGIIPDTESILASFKGKVADWWIPDSLSLVDSIPHTATGKISKAILRKQFASAVFK